MTFSGRVWALGRGRPVSACSLPVGILYRQVGGPTVQGGTLPPTRFQAGAATVPVLQASLHLGVLCRHPKGPELTGFCPSTPHPWSVSEPAACRQPHGTAVRSPASPSLLMSVFVVEQCFPCVYPVSPTQVAFGCRASSNQIFRQEQLSHTVIYWWQIRRPQAILFKTAVP